MIHIGIDPGLSGAVALYRDPRYPAFLVIKDVPTLVLPRGGKSKREVDIPRLWASTFLPYLPKGNEKEKIRVWIERVNAMPGQGVSSSFAFGKVYGILLGMIGALEIPYEFVAPQVWKKSLQVPASKDGARARASQLFPKSAHLWARAKDDGRAEAALIAYYGSLQKR